MPPADTETLATAPSPSVPPSTGSAPPSAESKAAEPKIEPPAAAAPSGGKGILFKNEFEILPSQPLSSLVPPPLKAFATRHSKGTPAYTVLCAKTLIPRLELIHKYTMLRHNGMPRLLASGILDWKPDGCEYYALVFDHAPGLPVVTDESSVALGWKEEFVRHVVLKSIVPVLQDLDFSELSHGNIRLSNMFTTDNKQPVPGAFDQLTLGECLSVPCGYSQPAIYLPAERILAAPAGRGDGGMEDDLYALGVCLALMMRTHDPNAGVSDQEIFARKIEQGSFVTLIGKSRISGILLELLRGLLQDDPVQRWTVEDLGNWMDGRRFAPKTSAIGKTKATRPLKFSGREYIRPPLLAMALTQNIPEAIQIIENGDLDNWITRSLEDKTLGKRVEGAIAAAHDHMVATGLQERIVTLVAMALAPNMPISYRGLVFMPDGFGRMLVHAYARGDNLNNYAEIIRFRLIPGWFEHGDITKFDVGVIKQRLMICSNSIKQTAAGHGLERCVYTMAPDAPCLSEKFSAYYIRSPDDLISATESLLADKKSIDNPFDRHVTAFMLARDPNSIDHTLPDLSSTSAYKRFTALLRSLTKLQTRHKDGRFPHITSWLVGQAQPLIERFHDRDYRATVREKLEKLRHNGDIQALLIVLDDAQQKQADYHAFRNAMMRFQHFKREHAKLEHELKSDPQFGYGTGREIAAMISGAISFLAIGVLVLLKLNSGGFGS